MGGISIVQRRRRSGVVVFSTFVFFLGNFRRRRTL
jgi:hypothetical protein